MVDLKETKIDGRFVIGQKLGSGSFGDIFLGIFWYFICFIDFHVIIKPQTLKQMK